MAENSGIEWTDHTFNPWIGCTKVSPACKNCYAERDFDHRLKKSKWGPSGTRVVTTDDYWRKPIRWNAEAERTGERPRVFCASLADVFEDWDGSMINSDGGELSTCWNHKEFSVWEDEYCPICGAEGLGVSMDHVRKRLFNLIDATPHLDWLLLTKRPENIIPFWPDGRRRENVWLGASVENQYFADVRVPLLLECRAISPVLFLSCEPVVGPIDLRRVHGDSIYASKGCSIDTLIGETTSRSTGCLVTEEFPSIDWVIAGGESGPSARAADPNWFRALRDQCRSSDVPFLFKQWGEWLPFGQQPMPEDWHQEGRYECTILNNLAHIRVGKKKAGRLLDGVTHDGVPAPKVTA